MCINLRDGAHHATEYRELMADTLRATGLSTKREVFELGLKTLLKLRQQSEIRKLRGQVMWEGDLGTLRRDK